MKNKPVLKRIFKYLTPHAGLIVISIISAVAFVLMNLWIPVLVGEAVNEIVGAGEVDFDAMLPIIICILGAAGVGAFCSWLMRICNNKIIYAAIKEIRTQAFAKLQKVPLKYIDSNSHGDILSRLVNDIDQMADGLMQGATQLFTGIATIAGTLIMMLVIDKSLALLVVCTTPISLFITYFIAKMSYKTLKVQMQERGELSGYAEEMITGVPVLKAFDYHKHAQKKFEEINSRMYKSGIKAQFYPSLTNPSTRLVNALIYAFIGIMGALQAIRGGIDVGQLTTLLIYVNQYTRPFMEITEVITVMQSAAVSSRRVFELIDEPSETPDAPDAVVMEKCRGDVGIENVSFSYEPDKKLIEGLNLYAETGERVAIVGPTGSGKTTIINLLMRFYDVDSGKICVDGIDIRTITRDSLRALYGMVLQETWLFTGSVRANIAFGNPDATDDEIIRAAKSAGAHGFITRLENGYDTIISDDGDTVSQGQKQLLCIARVMLTKPSMLILDEATSSIDTRTEMKIQKAFGKMMEGRTSFVVAHRLSTIVNSDIILVMNEGQIVEQGSHKELLNKNGFYAGLYKSQFENTNT